MVWMRGARYEQYWDLFVGGLFYFTSGEDALGVTVKQQGQHHLWRVRRTSATSIGLFYRTGVKLLHNLYHKTSQTVFIQPALAVPWYVDRFVSVNVDKMLADEWSPFPLWVILRYSISTNRGDLKDRQTPSGESAFY